MLGNAENPLLTSFHFLSSLTCSSHSSPSSAWKCEQVKVSFLSLISVQPVCDLVRSVVAWIEERNDKGAEEEAIQQTPKVRLHHLNEQAMAK